MKRKINYHQNKFNFSKYESGDSHDASKYIMNVPQNIENNPLRSIKEFKKQFTKEEVKKIFSDPILFFENLKSKDFQYIKPKRLVDKLNDEEKAEKGNRTFSHSDMHALLNNKNASYKSKQANALRKNECFSSGISDIEQAQKTADKIIAAKIYKINQYNEEMNNKKKKIMNSLMQDISNSINYEKLHYKYYNDNITESVIHKYENKNLKKLPKNQKKDFILKLNAIRNKRVELFQSSKKRESKSEDKDIFTDDDLLISHLKKEISENKELMNKFSHMRFLSFDKQKRQKQFLLDITRKIEKIYEHKNICN